MDVLSDVMATLDKLRHELPSPAGVAYITGALQHLARAQREMTPPPVPPSEASLQAAARAWCEPETSKLVMRDDLATAFARIIDREYVEPLNKFRADLNEKLNEPTIRHSGFNEGIRYALDALDGVDRIMPGHVNYAPGTVADVTNNKRDTFEIPEGWEAERDDENRVIGKLVLAPELENRFAMLESQMKTLHRLLVINKSL